MLQTRTRSLEEGIVALEARVPFIICNDEMNENRHVSRDIRY